MHKYLIMTMCMVVLILFLGISVNAESRYGFETTDLSPDEINQIWNSIKVRSLPETLSLDEMSTSIVSFDVSESENILIGLKNNRLIVLDNNKELLYGFQFSNDGSFYVRWEGDNILLLLVRGAIIVEFSTNGQLINMIEADDRSIENNNLWNQIRDRDKISINDSVYLVRNQMGFLNFFSSSYSQLVKKDIDGKEMVIYDVSTVHATKTAVMLIAVLLFWGLIISVIIWKSGKNVAVGENKFYKKN